IESAKIQLQTTRNVEINQEQQLSALRAKFAAGTIGAAEFEKDERALVNSLSDLKTRKAEQELALQEAVNRKIIEGLQLANQRAEAAINRSATTRTIAAKKELLNDPNATDPVTSEFADRRLSRTTQKIEAGTINDRVKLVQKELADNQKLFNEKRRSRKEFEQEEISLQQKLADLNNQRVDIELQRQKELRDSYKALRDSRIKQEEEVSKAQQASLDRSKQLIEAQARLSKAKSEASLAVDDSRLRSIDRASELKKKIDDDSTDPAVKAVARRQLEQIGVDPNATELQIAEQKAQIENEIAAKKIAAQEQEFKTAQMLLELDLQREQIAARLEKRKADRGRVEAEKNRNAAERDYNEALKGGDAREIQLAKNNLELAGADVGLAAQGQRDASESLSLIDQTADQRREALRLEQQKTRETTAEDEFLRLQNQEMSIAELGGKTPNAPSSFITPNALDTYSRVRNAGGDLSGMQARQPISQQAGNVINLPGMSGMTAGGGLTVTPSTGVGAIAPPIPQPDFSKVAVTPSEGKGQSFSQELVSFLGSKLDLLNSNIAKLANSPRSLSFTSQDPVSDFADFQNGQAASLMRG
ncbi:hypothetical protein H6F43_00540, partial [Leptolyngbya sp. FACHB-36]|uniref:hypothetical protein n=1 Tax=Leptolyngbya sp. FACHB-36 TaxID=2692808 RepID=UPI0016804CBD